MTISMPHDWKPRDYQMPFWSFMENGGKRACIVWHRRAGKDLTCVNWAATDMMQNPGLYWHIFPTYAQGKKIAWDGMTKTGRPFLDSFPKQLVAGKHNTEMKLTLKTGSIYQVVGADKPDSLVGPNPRGVILSEWSLMSPKIWDLMQPILAENGGWAIFVFTPRGRNHAHKTLVDAQNNPTWFAQVLPNSVTKAISQEAIQGMREGGMKEAMVQQEIECSFDAPVEGSYYGSIMTKLEKDGHICHVPYDPKLPVHTAWDLGMDDNTSIWFYQRYGFEIRLIDYYESSGEGLPHYAKVLKERDYVYGEHYAPHDIEVRELGTGKSRLETAKSLGIKFHVGRQMDIADGIEAVRSILPTCWFDKKKCYLGLEALRQYHKDYDDKNQTFRERPCHDWSSHGSDSFRELAVSMKNRPKLKGKPQTVADMNYDPFAL